MKKVCETEGCENAVRRHQTRCDDCIVAEARKRKRRRETTESSIRGGQGRSGEDVEESALFAAVAIMGFLALLLIAAVYQAVTDSVDAAAEAGRARAVAEKVRTSDQ